MVKRKTEEQEPNVKLILLSAFAGLLLLIFMVMWFMNRTGPVGYVTGTVTLNNEPVEGASVVFVMTDEMEKPPLESQTTQDGEYTMNGFDGKAIPIGTYKVMVTKIVMKDGKVPGGEARIHAEAKGLLKNSLPKAYENSTTTPLTKEVKAGKNVIDLELKK